MMVNLPSGTYRDLDSDLVGSGIILQPFSSMILVRIDSLTTGINESASPQKFMLWQNYPNPFNPTTTIKFSVGSASGRTGEPVRVTLKVYDVLGRELVTLVDERKQPGVYAVTWDAGNVPSGVYFYRLTIPTFSQTRLLEVTK